MIEIRKLDRKFGTFSLQSINLKIEPGDYTVVLGPSGCGKSLLLATLAGIHRPDHGEILLDNRPVTHLPPEKRPLGLVFQKPSLFSHLDVVGNITYGLRVTGVGRATRKERLDEMVRILGLQSLVHKPIESLSGGEAQKVVLARTLALRPKVLLLDEPLSQLDHNTRLHFQQELTRLHTQLKLTTLHVTHSRDEAYTLGTRYTIMLAGRILQSGKKPELMSAPICKYVARFLGIENQTDSRNFTPCSQICLHNEASCDRANDPHMHETVA